MVDVSFERSWRDEFKANLSLHEVQTFMKLYSSNVFNIDIAIQFLYLFSIPSFMITIFSYS